MYLSKLASKMSGEARVPSLGSPTLGRCCKAPGRKSGKGILERQKMPSCLPTTKALSAPPAPPQLVSGKETRGGCNGALEAESFLPTAFAGLERVFRGHLDVFLHQGVE